MNFFVYIKNKVFGYEIPEVYEPNTKPGISQYIEKRYKNQLIWYEKHATNSRIIYYTCQFLIILFSSLIPIINVVPFDDSNSTDVASNSTNVVSNTTNVANTTFSDTRMASAILGGLVIITIGVLQLTRARENWISYRSTAEVMKSEYHRFNMEAGEYSTDNTNEKKRIQLFTNRMETIISEEGKKFLESHKNTESNHPPDK